MIKNSLRLVAGCALLAATLGTAAADDHDDNRSSCRGLPSASQVRAALEFALTQPNGGLGNDMWASVVNRFGTVCLVVTSAEDINAVWLASRVISAQKANTGNALSLPLGAKGTDWAFSSANLYALAQPGEFLFGLQESNPVDPDVAYKGPASRFGAGAGDPMVGRRIGGINVFGGGLALYNPSGVRIGGLGVSGDTSCTDHFVAWRIRDRLVLDWVPGGPHPTADGLGDDNMIQDFNPVTEESPSLFGHPRCTNEPAPETLPPVQRPT